MLFIFFFNDTATTEIYTLSLHDALPISDFTRAAAKPSATRAMTAATMMYVVFEPDKVTPLSAARVKGLADIHVLLLRMRRSEEHTSELQSRQYLVCRLLLEKKKQKLH